MSSHEIITRYITGRNMSRCGSVNKCRYVCFCLGQTQITISSQETEPKVLKASLHKSENTPTNMFKKWMRVDLHCTSGYVFGDQYNLFESAAEGEATSQTFYRKPHLQNSDPGYLPDHPQ